MTLLPNVHFFLVANLILLGQFLELRLFVKLQIVPPVGNGSSHVGKANALGSFLSCFAFGQELLALKSKVIVVCTERTLWFLQEKLVNRCVSHGFVRTNVEKDVIFSRIGSSSK